MISRFLPKVVRRFIHSSLNGSAPTYSLVDRPEQLEPVVAALSRVEEVFIDTEADNMYHYRTRLCLVQLMVGKDIYLVDVLARGLDCTALWDALSRVHMVMHGSDFDLRLLRDLCQFEAKSLFDTMLAAQLLNRQRVGLAALLEEHFGVVLDKDHQKANWSRRPLLPKLLDYAATDVFYLPALRDQLTGELRRLGRLDWLDQQCRRQIESARVGFPRSEDDTQWRVGKSEKLRGRGLAVLHAMWHWREGQAERLDVPPFKVCSPDILLRFAHAAEGGGSLEAVLSAAHLGKRHERLLPSLRAAIETGLARDPQTLPRRRPRNPDSTPLTTEELARQDGIKTYRDQIATQLSLDPTLIANRSQLAQVARAPARIADILLPWQIELLREAPPLKAGPEAGPASGKGHR